MADGEESTRKGPLLLVPKRPANVRKRVSEESEPAGPPEGTTKITRRDERATAPDTSPAVDKLDYHFASSGSAAPLSTTLTSATAGAEHDTETGHDHRTIRETAQQLHQESISGAYLGRSNYFQYLERHDTTRANALSDKNFRAGPMRVASNIRNTCRFDYAPDLCKDYNETGFCGFGDSCKFVHDRGDYKAGWELDAEWDEQQRRIRDGLGVEEDYAVREVDDGPPPVPTTCGICDSAFTSPVVETKCGHRFCEKCALVAARASDKCKVCGTVINGQFKIVKIPSVA